jgi:hypothetical protein
MPPRRKSPTPKGEAAKRIRRDTARDGIVVDGSFADDSEAYTVARCTEAGCGKEAIKGGPIVPDEQMCRDQWPWCAFGEGWRWCCTKQALKRFKP